VEHNGQGVGFFSRGASRAPEIELLVIGFGLCIKNMFEHKGLEHTELLDVTKKAGFVGGDFFK
jgi:hypothetical protein